MDIIRFLKYISPFIKELILGDMTLMQAIKSNKKKASAFIFIMLGLATAFLMTMRSFDLAKQVATLKASNKTLTKELDISKGYKGQISELTRELTEIKTEERALREKLAVLSSNPNAVTDISPPSTAPAANPAPVTPVTPVQAQPAPRAPVLPPPVAPTPVPVQPPAQVRPAPVIKPAPSRLQTPPRRIIKPKRAAPPKPPPKPAPKRSPPAEKSSTSDLVERLKRLQ